MFKVANVQVQRLVMLSKLSFLTNISLKVWDVIRWPNGHSLDRTSKTSFFVLK